MRKVILFIATSLDGFIARTDGAVDWLYSDQDYDYGEFIESVDTLLMGRKTYEQVLTFGDWPYVDKDCIVFSSSAQASTEHASFTRHTPDELIAQLRTQPGKHIWLVGGGKLIASFLRAKLINELWLYKQPVMLGDGIPLLQGGLPEQSPTLIDTKSYSSGMIRLRYTFNQ